MKSQTSINSLIGKELVTVCFVLDYVEFHFDGPILRAINDPVITTSNETMAFPSPGSRDMLCALIGKKVMALHIEEGVQAVFKFSSGAKLTISLVPHINAGEAMHFHLPNSPTQFW